MLAPILIHCPAEVKSKRVPTLPLRCHNDQQTGGFLRGEMGGKDKTPQFHPDRLGHFSERPSGLLWQWMDPDPEPGPVSENVGRF